VTGTLNTAETRPVLRFERGLAHAPEKVWRAITEPAELAGWFPMRVDVDLRLGGAMRFVDEHGATSDGEITELDPPRVLAFTWYGDLLRFELRPEGGGCALVFTHSFDATGKAPKFAAGWHLCLDALESQLAGEQAPAGGAMDAWDELYDDYARRFGARVPDGAGSAGGPAPDGTLERAGERYVLRYERRLARPVERVWMALTRPDELVKWLAEADIDPTPGGRVELRWLNTDEEGRQGVARGTITRLEWPHLLEIDTDVHGLLRWELRREGEHACTLTLTVSAELPDDEAPEYLAGWHIHLDHLAEALAGRPVDWSSWGRDHRPRFAELRDRYAALRSS